MLVAPAPSTSCPPRWQTPLPPDVEGAWFDQAAVDKVLNAFRALRHTKGKWAGVAFEPEPWQVEDILAPIFGWKGPDGNRIIRTAWIEVPRKNGKSTLAAGFGLVLLAADGEQGAEVYAAATSKEQARVVFDEAKRMAEATPALRSRTRRLASAILYPSSNGVFRVISHVADAQHGLNISGGVVDEVHVHKSRDLIDVIETGTGAREQPLILFITTADDGDETGIYAEKHNYGIQLAKGIVSDPTFYAAIWAADPEDDPFAESTWRKANPGYGVTVKADYLKKEAERAKATPTYYGTFLRLHLNRRTRAESRFLALDRWDAAAGLVNADELERQPCFAGLDLANTTDIAALALLFPRPGGTYDVLCHFWVPKERMALRQQRDRVPYVTWERLGLITATEGDVIDYAAIKETLLALRSRFRIKEVAYDPWNATQLVQELQDKGFTMVPVRQGYASMSAPTKELEKLVLGQVLRHGGNPVLRWMADNLIVRKDPAGNLKPDKEKSREKIDGMVALIMALDRAMRHTRSAYEDRGLLVV